MYDGIMASLDPSDIDMLSKIVEAYEHLGIVSTLDRRRGLVVVHCTSDTRRDMLRILSCLPFSISLFISL